MGKAVNIEVAVGDVLTVAADVLALKYARAFYGADLKVAQRLAEVGVSDISPELGRFRIVAGTMAVSALKVMFVGVRDLYDFRYKDIREFSVKVLTLLATEVTATRVLALTLHGPGVGLDERECFLSELAGIADAVMSGDYPVSLETIKIVEHDERRAMRLRVLLDEWFPGGILPGDPRAHRMG